MTSPTSGFRLNAPQTDEEVEGSAPFGGVDILEVQDDGRPSQPSATQSRTTETPSEPIAASSSNLTPQPSTRSQKQENRPSTMDLNNERTMRWLRWLIVVGTLVVLLLIGLIVTVAISFREEGEARVMALRPTRAPAIPTLPPRRPTVAPTLSPTLGNEPTPEPQTTLDRIYQRGYLLCGVAASQPGFSEVDLVTGERYGFDVDMCRAIAAAIFGEAHDRVQYVTASAFDRFISLANYEFDVLSRATTHTMERDVLEPRSLQGFRFAIPYLYNGLQFGGLPPYVYCADNLTVASEICQDTIICALDGTTHIDLIASKIPNARVISVVGNEFLYRNFAQGLCNVIAGEQFDIAQSLVEKRGYDGPYEYGRNVHSKEPLAMVTRDEDEQWSDFVNWVMQTLLVAEEYAISSRTYSLIKTTELFGERYASAFRNAVKAVGNYAEIYRRNLEDLLPRPPPDKINEGGSGVIYAFPFGNLIADGALPGGTIQAILDRGHLRCGMSRRLMFAQFNTSIQEWDGFDIDFCKAISAALFNGVTNTIVYRDLPASERFQALQSGDVDVLSRLTTVTASRDIQEENTGVGFSFSQPNFYDGMTFGGIPPFGQCADRLDVTSISCRDLLICVNTGTTFETKLQTLFPERFIVPRLSGELSVEGLALGQCNVVAGGVVDVSLTNVRNSGYHGHYQTGSSRYSKDPLALVTRQDDSQWSKFVFWIVSAIFWAEEQGITMERADEMPLVALFGDDLAKMFQLAVGAVGNYAEIYKRQVEGDVPRGGLNEGNAMLSGPQHYPLPGIV